MSRPFLKMNGLGNDFVVVDALAAPFAPSADEVRALADRGRGIGCDQLVAIEPSTAADVRVRFWNADGEAVGACGNASRCVAQWVMDRTGRDAAVLETDAGLLSATRAGRNVTVDMGRPRLRWDEIPLAEDMDTRGIELQVGPIDNPVLHTPGCVSMGNPHVVFFVSGAQAAPVREVGPLIERHMLFPEGVNVGFAQIKARDRIRLRVWERGAGLTLACGTGACAALVAAHRRGLVDRRATLELDGGELVIEWRVEDDHVLMTGPAVLEYEGTLP
ncbi:diaminopimelate epimerase [Phenylobacterium sp.]|uniref:diaminopimelate epimerase n=1 Tax=Phenylobacterium sp. TaxID=1871053 RepID=UPI002E37921D|nr:diaminopimelate epimerase [Phenylobacterium sp.]HEX2558635.1 diaminopimelate epimerase [Phenylobacterium sp.]